MSIMNIFKPKEEKGIKNINVKPFLKKAYGKNWRVLSQVSKNTKAIEDVVEQLSKLNEKMNHLTDK